MISPKRYQSNLEPMRWARNGMIPNAGFIGGSNGVIGRTNHILSYRRKCFLTTGDLDTTPTGLTGSNTLYRTYCHTGHAATHIAFVLGIAKDIRIGGTDPRVEVTVTVSGGASTTETIHYGLNSEALAVDAGPSSLGWFHPRIPVSADTRYEIAIVAIDYARPIVAMAYEIGETVIDSATNYFHEHQVGVGYPIYDSLRSTGLIGLSQIWRHNASHLLTWPGAVDGVSPTFASTTWTNLLDGSTGAVSSSTPGYYLGGDSGTYLTQHVRQSDSSTQKMDIVFAVHGSMSAGSTGEVRLEDSTGTRASITGITTTAQWHVSTGSIGAVDTMGKVDLQARTSNAANTLTVNAVALLAYLT